MPRPGVAGMAFAMAQDRAQHSIDPRLLGPATIILDVPVTSEVVQGSALQRALKARHGMRFRERSQVFP